MFWQPIPSREPVFFFFLFLSFSFFIFCALLNEICDFTPFIRYVEAVKQSVASLPKTEANVVKKGSKKKSKRLAVPEISDAQARCFARRSANRCNIAAIAHVTRVRCRRSTP